MDKLILIDDESLIGYGEEFDDGDFDIMYILDTERNKCYLFEGAQYADARIGYSVVDLTSYVVTTSYDGKLLLQPNFDVTLPRKLDEERDFAHTTREYIVAVLCTLEAVLHDRDNPDLRTMKLVTEGQLIIFLKCYGRVLDLDGQFNPRNVELPLTAYNIVNNNAMPTRLISPVDGRSIYNRRAEHMVDNAWLEIINA